MFKKFIIALFVAVPAFVSAQVKFGVADVEAVFAAMPETAAANTQLQEAQNKFQSEYKTLEEEMNKKVAEFQQLQNDPNTPQSIKERRIQDMQDMDERAKQFMATAQQDLQRQQAQLMQPIQEKLINAIKQVGAENGFTMIFPVGQAIYESADVVDVTDLVRTKLGIK
ncbi:MAG: OmpH family outer membrane protein [Muribaculaceae bacterium]|nr:OmpH family outer membrane protein [Muribaculaceae bacterium]